MESNLQEILELARVTVQALDELVEQIRVEDRNRYHYIRKILPEIISFEEFSLAEYTFHLPGDLNPGIRLWLTSTGFQQTLQVLHFPDVLQWRVDRQGQRLHTLLASLDISAPVPQVIGEVVSPREGPDWRETLIRSISEKL